MTRLLKMFLCKFVGMQIIKCGELTDVNFSDPQNQLLDDMIAVGKDCRRILADSDDIPPAAQQKFTVFLLCMN